MKNINFYWFEFLASFQVNHVSFHFPPLPLYLSLPRFFLSLYSTSYLASTQTVYTSYLITWLNEFIYTWEKKSLMTLSIFENQKLRIALLMSCVNLVSMADVAAAMD